MKLLDLLRRRRTRPTPKPIDSERLLRIYRETHRQVEDLRRAA
jgi:hypothetical protein